MIQSRLRVALADERLTELRLAAARVPEPASLAGVLLAGILLAAIGLLTS